MEIQVIIIKTRNGHPGGYHPIGSIINELVLSIYKKNKNSYSLFPTPKLGLCFQVL